MLSENEMAICAKYEKNLRTAVSLDYCSYPGREGVRAVYEIYKSNVRDPEPLHESCGYCILKVFKAVGGLYIESLKEKVLVEAKAKKAPRNAKKLK